jgi:hypothetical protein
MAVSAVIRHTRVRVERVLDTFKTLIECQMHAVAQVECCGEARHELSIHFKSSRVSPPF